MKGFTLIEILVVLLIIGITLGFALLAFGDFGKSRRLVLATDQFVNTVRLAQQQAILESSTLGIVIKNNSYQIYRFQPPARWQPVSNKGLFGLQQFPDDAVIRLRVTNTATTGAPNIIITPSGDLTPFQLSIGNQNNASIRTLTGRHDGLLSLQASTAS